MANDGSHGVEPPRAASPQQQRSPALARSPAFGSPGVVRYWAQQDNPKHGVQIRQIGGRLDSRVVPTWNFHPFLPPRQIAALSHNTAVAAQNSPYQPAGSRIVAQPIGSQLQANSPQSCFPLLCRSVTPVALVYSKCHPPQTAPRPASTGSKAAAAGAHTVADRSGHEQLYCQSQKRHLPTAFWHAGWARQTNRAPVSAQQLVAPQQQLGSVAQLKQSGSHLESLSGTEKIPALQSRLSRIPGATTSSARANGLRGREQFSYVYPHQSARGNSPPPQLWRPVSVPPQGHKGLHNTGFAANSPCAGHHVADRAPVYVSHVCGPQGIQMEFKKNRSASTPPLVGRQLPSLASRFLAFFQIPADKSSQVSGSAVQRASDAEPSSNRESHWERQVAPTMSWAYPARGDLEHMQMGSSSNQQRIKQVRSMGATASPAPSVNVDLLQSPRQGTLVEQRKPAGLKGPMDPGAFQQIIQQQTSVQQGSPAVLLTTQNHPGAQCGEPSTQISASPAQVPQHFGAQLQRDQFLWQQQQLLRRQQTVLQQQREKLMQQQAYLQKQKQRNLMQKNVCPQAATQQPDHLEPQAPPAGYQPAERSKHFQASAMDFAPKESGKSTLPVKPTPEKSSQKYPVACEAVRAELAPSDGLQTVPLEPAPQGSKPLQQLQPTAPPLLEWQLREPVICAAGSSGARKATAAQTRNLSFTAVGGSLEQRMQLTCDVLVDPASSLKTTSSVTSASNASQATTEAQSDSQLGSGIERREYSPREQTRPDAGLQNAIEDPGEAVSRDVCSPRDGDAKTVHFEEVCSACESDSQTGVKTGDGKQASGEQLALRLRGSPPQQVSFPLSFSLAIGSQNRFAADQHDLIPVGPLIAALSAVGAWGGHAADCPDIEERSEADTDVDAYLPIESLSELESVDKDEEVEDLLDLRRDVIGCGTYGVVRKLRHRKGGFMVAVKSIQKETVVRAGMVSQVEFELYVQRDLLRHQNVLRCYSCVEDAEYLHMVLGYCEHGDLYRRIREQPDRRFSELEAFCYFSQLVNGLQCVHSRGIIHRDLKLENLLLTSDNILKLADFGWCGSVVGRNRSFSFCGTLDYLAPEMVKGQGHDWRVDLWSLGVLLYELLDGRPPFQSTRHFELVHRIVTVDIRMPSHVRSDAADLIRKLLKYDPSERLPLVDVAQHPWVLRMWEELQLHLLELDPTVDLEALLPLASEALPELAMEEKQNPVLCQTPEAQAPQRRTADLAGSWHGSAAAKGYSGSVRNGMPRGATRSPSVHTRQQLAATKALNFPPLSSRKSPRGSNFESPAPSEKSGKKGVSGSRISPASPYIQPRRRTLPRLASLATQTRAVRSTSKAPVNTAARRAPAARSSDTADASVAQSAAKKTPAKWRPMSTGHRNRGRLAPLVDQSFDLPSALPREDKCEGDAPLRQTNPSTPLLRTDEHGGDRQTPQVDVANAGHVFSPTAQSFQQHVDTEPAIQTPSTGAHLPPQQSGVTFSMRTQWKQDPAEPTPGLLASRDYDAGPINDATALPSLKKLRGLSTHLRKFAPPGAVLRMRSHTKGLSGAREREDTTVSSACLYPGQRDCQGVIAPKYESAMAFPTGREQPSLTTLASLQTISSAGIKAPIAGSTTYRKSMRTANPMRLANTPSTIQRCPVAFLRQPLIVYAPQRQFHQTVQPNRLACLQEFPCFTGGTSTALRWYQQLPKNQAPAYQLPSTGGGYRHLPHKGCQPAQNHRPADITADIPAVQHLHSPAHNNGICELKLAATQSSCSPLGRFAVESPSSAQQKADSQVAAVNLPSSTSEPVNAACIPGLPVVIATAGATNSPKFLSNPNSLFC